MLFNSIALKIIMVYKSSFFFFYLISYLILTCIEKIFIMKRFKVIAVEGLQYVVSGQWHRTQANAKTSFCNNLTKAIYMVCKYLKETVDIINDSCSCAVRICDRYHVLLSFLSHHSDHKRVCYVYYKLNPNDTHGVVEKLYCLFIMLSTCGDVPLYRRSYYRYIYHIVI